MSDHPVQNLSSRCTIRGADEASVHAIFAMTPVAWRRDLREMEAQFGAGRVAATVFFHRDIFIRQKFAPPSTYKSEPDPGVLHPPLSRERLN
jgi:hypothetical protein